MMIVWGKPLIDTYWNYGSMTSAKLTTVNPTINIGDSNAEWQLPHLVQAHHPFRQLLAHAACGKKLKHLEHVWAMLSNLEEPGVIFEHSSTHAEKIGSFFGPTYIISNHFFSGKFGSFRAILNNFWEDDMVLSALVSFQHVPRLLWNSFLSLKQVPGYPYPLSLPKPPGDPKNVRYNNVFWHPPSL
jgi:hypothetical protein